MSKKIVVIGLGLPTLDPSGKLTYQNSLGLSDSLFSHADIVIGGKQQLDLLGSCNASKLPVSADIEGLITHVKSNLAMGLRQVAIATGDPLFFGLGSTLVNYLGKDNVEVRPALGSMNGALSLLGMSSADIQCISLHGPRDWNAFSRGLVSGMPLFLLTDKKSHPGAIATYMQERGCTQYSMRVFGDIYTLDGMINAVENKSLSLESASEWENMTHSASQFVVVLLPEAWSKTRLVTRSFGLSDESFQRSDNVMTKKAARISGLGFLGVSAEHIVWDLGAGTGSVSIEAARLASKGTVYAIERNALRVEHIIENRRLLCVPNLEVLQGELPDCLVGHEEDNYVVCNGEQILRPDRVFIGGGCGSSADKTQTLLQKSFDALMPDGRIVIASVLLSTLERARNFFLQKNIRHELISIQSSSSSLLGEDYYMKAQNPVQFIVAYK